MRVNNPRCVRWLSGLLKTMSTTTAGAEPPKTQSRRERAFLGQLPSDFLRVEPATTASASSSGYRLILFVLCSYICLLQPYFDHARTEGQPCNRLGGYRGSESWRGHGSRCCWFMSLFYRLWRLNGLWVGLPMYNKCSKHYSPLAC